MYIYRQYVRWFMTERFGNRMVAGVCNLTGLEKCPDPWQAVWSAITEDIMRKTEKRVEGAGDRVLADPEMKSKFPDLWDHLTATKWDDGSPRMPSSLLIFAQDGTLKGMLRDREAGLCAWVAAPTMGGVFQTLQAAIADPDFEWRTDRQTSGDQAKRTKRK